jgi:hypothetical protein
LKLTNLNFLEAKLIFIEEFNVEFGDEVKEEKIPNLYGL